MDVFFCWSPSTTSSFVIEIGPFPHFYALAASLNFREIFLSFRSTAATFNKKKENKRKPTRKPRRLHLDRQQHLGRTFVSAKEFFFFFFFFFFFWPFFSIANAIDSVANGAARNPIVNVAAANVSSRGPPDSSTSKANERKKNDTRQDAQI